MPDLTGLRSRNFTMLDTIAQEAEPRLRTWARKHGSAVPAGWNAPVTGPFTRRSALELSYLADFSELAPASSRDNSCRARLAGSDAPDTRADHART